MHSCELITNLRAKKVLCHCVEVVKNFRCCNHRLCFLQLDWHEQNYSSKSNQLNEAEESAEGHQTLFFLVRGRGLGTRLANTKLRIVPCPDPALHKEMGVSAFLVVPSLNSGQTNDVMQCHTCIDISQ